MMNVFISREASSEMGFHHMPMLSNTPTINGDGFVFSGWVALLLDGKPESDG